jgi:hypothetical protein
VPSKDVGCQPDKMKILTVSDKVEQLLYGPALKRLHGDVDLVLGAGDLPFYYLEFIVTMLGGPLLATMPTRCASAMRPRKSGNIRAAA